MTDTTTTETGAATGGVRTLLRLEGLTLLAGMTLLYAVWGGSWWVYFALFLAPDLSFAAYFLGPRLGAAAYNLLHSTIAPLALGGGLQLAAGGVDIAAARGAHRGRDAAFENDVGE